MGMLVNWYIEGRAIQVYAWGELTIEELSAGAEETRQRIRQGRYIYDIVDMRHMSKYPIRLAEIIPVTSLFREANLGWVLLISSNPVVRFLASATVQVHGARFRAFNNPDEVKAFIQTLEPDLGELPAYIEPIPQAES